jgi:ribosomal-protein-alanine N-acetyltransferase
MLDKPQIALTFRPAEPRDIDTVLELQRNGFGEDPHCPDAEGLANAIKDRRIDLVVAEARGEVVGYFLLNNRPFRLWTALDYIAVAPELRSGGIGERLIQCVFETSRRRRLRLFVRQSNTRAIEFYRRHGFEKTGIRQKNYHDGEDAVIMMRRQA